LLSSWARFLPFVFAFKEIASEISDFFFFYLLLQHFLCLGWAISDASIFFSLINTPTFRFLFLSIRREMEDHNELDDRNSLTSHGSANADNDKVRPPFQFGIDCRCWYL
jgi:hypothetical protein